MNAYHQLVSEYSRLLTASRNLSLGGLQAPPSPAVSPDASVAMFFAPHPDDECISGGLALRLLREAGMRVLNVAVTQGSKRDRQEARWRELEAACKYLGFGLLGTRPGGLERINATTRREDIAHWAACVTVIRNLIEKHSPRVLLFPHDQDWNSTHIGTHYLVMDALRQLPATYECFLVETEYWGQMDDPNLMCEITGTDLADLMAGTSFHVGEVKRNPFHLLMPGWMEDNVRRGTELVGGQGGPAPDFSYAALYRLRRWRNHEAIREFNAGRFLSRSQNPNTLFA